MTFKAKDSEGMEHSFVNEGYWGPEGGFDIPAEYEATTEWKLVFSKAGNYTITFSLIDADTEQVIADITDTVEINVKHAESGALVGKMKVLNQRRNHLMKAELQ